MYAYLRKMGNQSSREAHAENWQLKEENSKLEQQIKELRVSTSYKLMSLKKLLEEIASRF
jgi:cell division protein FtsB